MALVLLGTDACHLCEEAQALLMHFQGALKEDVYIDDIAEDPVLVERYGLRIPVLRHEGSGAELNWPFDSQQLLQFFRDCDCLTVIPVADISH